MFSVGDLIVYNETGVCRVEQIGPPAFNPRERRDYYTLTPLYSAGTIYVPVDSGVFMRPVLSREEAEELIDRLPEIQRAHVDNRDYRAAAQQYQGFLKTHRCEDLVQLIKEVYLKGQEQAKAGKKPSKVDQEFRKRAETLLHGELSAALGIPVEEIPEYITRRIQSAEAARGCAV